MNPEVLCMGCMEEIGAAAVCPHCGRNADQPAASPLHLPPRTLLHNQYLLGRALGHGGFGITYLGWDLNLARRLAVKEYLPGGMGVRSTGSRDVTPYSGQAEAFQWGLEKFLEEARVLARFQNQPGIVAVLNFFRENETAYLVMEYLDGITLQEYLNRHGETIDPATTLRIMMPVMDALRVVHKAGVLHRDISPDNIYVCGTGQVKVLDFGAARYALSQQSRSLSIILKEGYAPEEQYRSKGNQGPWTDVYATAATLYRAITGRVPPPALDRKEQDELIPPRDAGAAISPQLEDAMMKALSIRAADRFASMDDFQTAVALAPEAAAGLSHDTKTIAEIGRTIAGQETRAIPPPGGAGETRPMRREPSVTPAPIQTVGETRFVPHLKAEEKRVPEKPNPRKAFPISPKWLAAAVAAMLVGGVLFFRHPKPQQAGPAIKSFRAENNRIERGKSAILMWNVTGDADVSLDPGGKPVPSFGSYEVHPAQTTTYTLSARNRSGIDAQKVTIEVVNEALPETAPPVTPPVTPPEQQQQRRAVVPPTEPPVAPPARENRRPVIPPSPQPQRALTVETFSVEPKEVQPGQPVTLQWSVPSANHVEIAPMIGSVQPQGQMQVRPQRSGTFYLTATNASGGRAAQSTSVTVIPPATPPVQQPERATPIQITIFDGPPSPIAPGQPAMLRWSVQGASQIVVQPQVGPVAAEGTRPVYPQVTTTYVLIATAPGQGRVQATTIVQVTPQNTTYRQENTSQVQGQQRTVDNNQQTRGFSTAVIHDHGGGVGGALGGALGRIGGRSVPTSNDYCSGQLSVQPPYIRFNSGSGHSFTALLTDVSEVGLNRVPIQNSQAFHVRLNNGSNYNFVPRGTTASRAVSEIQGFMR